MDVISQVSNPFNITKASDFSNQEIADYWVDFHTGSGQDLMYYLSPTDPTPKYVIGGKGCGKTHLLRYYSFPLQRLRYNDQIQKIIENDKYIGLNIDLGAMNSARMFGCGIEEDQWDRIFGYYVELFVCLNIIDTIEAVFKGLELSLQQEHSFVEKLKNRICINRDVDYENTLNAFKNYINNLKKIVDYHINNAALKRSIDYNDLQIKLSPGDVFFIIPTLLVNEIPELKNVRFIFILDELEKLREYQKVYVNTLVWDKRIPTTFWIGARTYGFTTRKTKTGEVLRNGSEIQEIPLDEIMREDEDKYKEFATNLCAKRLKNFIKVNIDDSPESIRKEIDKYFEPFNEEVLFLRISRRGELPHQRKFKTKVKEGILKKQISNVSISDLSKIFDDEIRNDNLLIEKYRIFHFYKEWSKTKNGNVILESLKRENVLYSENKEKSILASYEEKFKLDFLAQLIFENNLKLYPYHGLINFIKISSGNPRAFLVILKEIFERSKLNHEAPFEKLNGVRIKTQSIGIYQASKWFYEDTEAYGEEGKYLYRCIRNLAELLQGIRYSDKPTETSPSSFSFKPEKVSEPADKFISLAVIHKILIQVKGRHDKNSERVEKAYQLNRMLAPYFNLPISRRGIVPLNETLIEAIFDPAKHSDFQGFYNEFISKMNAPFGIEAQTEMF
jgi:hypothetical protein